MELQQSGLEMARVGAGWGHAYVIRWGHNNNTQMYHHQSAVYNIPNDSWTHLEYCTITLSMI